MGAANSVGMMKVAEGLNIAAILSLALTSGSVEVSGQPMETPASTITHSQE